MDQSEATTERVRGVRRVLLATLVALLASSGAARADEYDPQRAGHPLRIVAYALHPVGFMIDYLILRPAHWIGSHEPYRSMFGHTD
ncbi:MAG TPA: hypothetical protein VFG80_02010 [Myxococcota bacterium]|nr:hypothetical protein [Myxococcota bacterium]